MPVRRVLTMNGLLSLSPSLLLLSVMLVPTGLRAEETPGMAFLEYLGGVEAEIDGRLSSPVELDLESAIVAATPGDQARQGKTARVNATRTEENRNSGVRPSNSAEENSDE